MSLELCILASGSSGNCALLRTSSGVMVIDIGIGPRAAATRMMAAGVSLSQIAAVCLTHLDRDHFNCNWIKTIISRGITVYCHQGRVEQMLTHVNDAGHDAEELRPLVRSFDGRSFEPLPGVRFSPLRLAHDQSGTHGFVVEAMGGRMGYATDLGRVPRQLVDSFEDLDILALESNYDPQMQISSSRPWFLKRRIMGGFGHLSNEEAFAAVREILDRSQARKAALPTHVVLLHRSQQCNCPHLLRELFSRDARLASRLTLAEQDRATPWLRSRRIRNCVGEQLSLQFTAPCEYIAYPGRSASSGQPTSVPCV